MVNNLLFLHGVLEIRKKYLITTLAKINLPKTEGGKTNLRNLEYEWRTPLASFPGLA